VKSNFQLKDVSLKKAPDKNGFLVFVLHPKLKTIFLRRSCILRSK